MKIETLPQASKFSPANPHMDVLARLIAPKVKGKTKRPSLNLGLALDQSGSMATNDAFGQAKEAALSLLTRLEDTDRIAVVLYNGSARIILPSCPVSEARTRLPSLLAGERANGSTALHRGWLTAAQQIAPHVNEYGISRVLLLSDGQATDGKCDPSELKEEAHQLMGAGISTGTYGLGMHFNEVLMTEMAVGGPARFAQDADQLIPYFSADFDLLAQTVAPSVFLKVQAEAGETSMPVELLNDYQKDANGFWRLPAAVSGAETWAALRIDMSNAKTAKSIKLMAHWKWVDNQGKQHEQTHETTIAGGKGKINETVVERCAEAVAARMAKEAATAARVGNFALASHTIGLMRGLSAGNAYINSVSDNLDSLVARRDSAGLSKEALYSSNTMSNRVAEIGESAATMAADRFGLRKSVQGKHSSAMKEGDKKQGKTS